MALTTEPRNDLHLTSTGVGHNYQESMKFPPDGFKVGMKKCRPKQAIEKKTDRIQSVLRAVPKWPN